MQPSAHRRPRRRTLHCDRGHRRKLRTVLDCDRYDDLAPIPARERWHRSSLTRPGRSVHLHSAFSSGQPKGTRPRRRANRHRSGLDSYSASRLAFAHRRKDGRRCRLRDLYRHQPFSKHCYLPCRDGRFCRHSSESLQCREQASACRGRFAAAAATTAKPARRRSHPRRRR